jgi:hypothetical protein
LILLFYLLFALIIFERKRWVCFYLIFYLIDPFEILQCGAIIENHSYGKKNSPHHSEFTPSLPLFSNSWENSTLPGQTRQSFINRCHIIALIGGLKAPNFSEPDHFMTSFLPCNIGLQITYTFFLMASYGFQIYNKFFVMSAFCFGKISSV